MYLIKWCYSGRIVQYYISNQKQQTSFNLTCLDKSIYFIRLTGKEGYMDLKFVKTD